MIRWRNRGRPATDGGDDPQDWDRRVRFICCDGYDDHESYSPAIYLRVGGGRRAFETVRRAAPFLRPEDPGSSAAGLCGFLSNDTPCDGETGGTMSLDPPPQPGADGKIDWDAYDGDIILIDVRARSARCCHGVMAGREIRDLPLGEPRTDKP